MSKTADELTRITVPRDTIDAWVDINRYLRTGDCSLVTSKVKKITGNRPIPFRQFCRDYASALSTDKEAIAE